MNIALALIFLLLFQPLVAAYLVGFHLERLTEAEYPLRRMILWQMLLTAIAMVSAFVIAALVSLPFNLSIARFLLLNYVLFLGLWTLGQKDLLRRLLLKTFHMQRWTFRQIWYWTVYWVVFIYTVCGAIGLGVHIYLR